MIRKLLAGMLYSQARWFLSLGRLGWGQGGRLLRLACMLWPRHPEACDWLKFVQGKNALLRGKPEVALPLLIEAERTLPLDVGVRVEIGLAQAMAGNCEQAIPVLERALKEPAMAAREDAWSSLAWCYIKTRRAPKAREACIRAEHVEVHSSRLALLHRLAVGVGLGALPVGEISDLLRRVPDAGVLLLEFARLQAQDGGYRLARNAVSAFPEEEQPRICAIIARASLNEDDPDTAAWAAECLQELAADQFAADIALILSEVALRKGDDDQALALARQATTADGGGARAHEQAGRVLLLAGDWNGAVDEMIEALHGGDAGPLAAGVAALAALEVGDQQSARGVFLASRSGDALGCAVSHVAQARLLLAEGSLTEPLQLAEWALGELAELPGWAVRPALVRRLSQSLREVLQTVRDAAEDEPRRQAALLLQKLDALGP